MIKTISGWGLYPKQKSIVKTPINNDQIKDFTVNTRELILPRAMGRSYGDSSLSEHVIQMNKFRYFINFDQNTGLLECDSGVTIEQIVKYFLIRGWFLSVTPGTQYVSIGGAIASDVHGKNHHVSGSFSNYLLDIKILLGDGQIVNASRDENNDLFFATCGGMGLTGIILSARFYLKRISSSLISQTTLKAKNLDEALELFEENILSHYSVAWLDCMATGESLGRSLIILGEHATNGDLYEKKSKIISIPITMPISPINNITMRIFNELHYQKQFRLTDKRVVSLQNFFYPLDKIKNWNRLYGTRGFVQYQCVIPKFYGRKGIKKILEIVSNSGQGSFLTVLKVLGPENENYLSFPMEGYTLALDFTWNIQVQKLLDNLDKVVSHFGGRLYLAKDSRMSHNFFKEGYKRLDQFEKVREKYNAVNKFESIQSRRLKIK